MIRDRMYQMAINAFKKASIHYTFNVRQVKVETTKVCNLKCVGCRRNYSTSISSAPGEKHLTTGDLWRILASTSMMLVRFEGDGEPLCNPHFKDLMSMCMSVGVRSAMTCNGTLLDEAYIKFLEDHGMARIHISFDGAHKDTFEKLRVGADYDKVLHNCKLIGGSKIQLFMNCLLSTDEVVDQLPYYALLARDVGATGVHIMKYQAESLNQWQPPNLAERQDILRNFYETLRGLKLMCVSTITDRPTFVGCDDATICPYVLINGSVFACSYMANLRESEVYMGKQFVVPHKNYLMGNVRTHWLKDIWKGPNYKGLREYLRRTRPKRGTVLTPEELVARKKLLDQEDRYAYCAGCLSRWGESGI